MDHIGPWIRSRYPELQSFIHRRWESETGIACQVNKRVGSRKLVEKTPCSQFSTLREVDAVSSLSV